MAAHTTNCVAMHNGKSFVVSNDFGTESFGGFLIVVSFSIFRTWMSRKQLVVAGDSSDAVLCKGGIRASLDSQADDFITTVAANTEPRAVRIDRVDINTPRLRTPVNEHGMNAAIGRCEQVNIQ